MNPYKLALDYKYKILDYYNKLLIKKPSLITFVVNPWFNQELNISKTNIQGLNIQKNILYVFYRSLSRRIFIELTKDSTDMGEFYPELKNQNLKISDIASLITGIIFIYDDSITKTGKDIFDTNIFLNPNAKNVILRNSDFYDLSSSPKIEPFIDDFNYDNY